MIDMIMAAIGVWRKSNGRCASAMAKCLGAQQVEQAKITKHARLYACYLWQAASRMHTGLYEHSIRWGGERGGEALPVLYGLTAGSVNATWERSPPAQPLGNHAPR